jgi:hypothetical protein
MILRSRSRNVVAMSDCDEAIHRCNKKKKERWIASLRSQ